jgi:DNA-binding MarR family transcriptional regulator
MDISPNRLDREAKIKVFSFAQALRHKTYGAALTGKHLAVLEALLRLGGAPVDPEEIAARAACSKTSFHAAIRELEAVGILIAERRGRVVTTITFVVPELPVPTPPWVEHMDWEG